MCRCNSDECYECMQRQSRELSLEKALKKASTRKQLKPAEDCVCHKCGERIATLERNLVALWADHKKHCPGFVLTQRDKDFLHDLLVGWPA